MSDTGSKQLIKAIHTESGSYSVGDGMYPDCYKKITITEKSGDMAYVIWYQLWYGGRVEKEINSRYVVSVDYQSAEDEPMPF